MFIDPLITSITKLHSSISSLLDGKVVCLPRGGLSVKILDYLCQRKIFEGGVSLEEKLHFSTCLRRLKVSFVTIFDQK